MSVTHVPVVELEASDMDLPCVGWRFGWRSGPSTVEEPKRRGLGLLTSLPVFPGKDHFTWNVAAAGPGAGDPAPMPSTR